MEGTSTMQTYGDVLVTLGTVYGLFVWVVGVVLCMNIARAKGHSRSDTVLMGIFFGPVITYLYLLAMPPAWQVREYEARWAERNRP